MTDHARYYSPDEKQVIIDYYTRHRGEQTFVDVAREFQIKGGGRTVQRWRKRRRSLETKKRSGRPRKLNTTQVRQYITHPAAAANDRGETIHYPTLHQAMPARIRRSVAPSTVRRYGKQYQAIKHKRTIKRTAEQRTRATPYVPHVIAPVCVHSVRLHLHVRVRHV